MSTKFKEGQAFDFTDPEEKIISENKTEKKERDIQYDDRMYTDVSENEKALLSSRKRRGPSLDIEQE